MNKGYKICKDCLKNTYPELKITGMTDRSSKRMTTIARKIKLQEEVDAKLNKYLGG